MMNRVFFSEFALLKPMSELALRPLLATLLFNE